MSMVVIGAVFVDVKGYPLENYIPAGRNKGRVETVHGGVCRNITEDIANLELRPTYVALVDDTGIGEDVLRKLKRHKVNTEYMRAVPDGMGTWLAIFDNNGDVVASISKRPDLSEIGRILDEKGDEIFAQADSILLELDLERDILKRIFSYAEKYRLPVYAAVSNMSIALDRRDYIKHTDCFVCNQQEAGLLFYEDYETFTPEQLRTLLLDKVSRAMIPRMVVTMGAQGAVYATAEGESGFCPARKVDVIDTTGAGDAFFAGVSVGLTYHKSLAQACEIGARLSASVIISTENVCPRFLPSEFELEA